MTTAQPHLIGSLDLVDVDVINEFYGGDFLPYPFMFTRPSRFADDIAASVHARTVPDRLRHGDLGHLATCIAAYRAADVRVVCHVQNIPSTAPSVRVIAYRTGHLGFIAQQRPDADIVDVHSLSPYELSGAICDAVSLTCKGSRHEVVIPDYSPPRPIDPDAEEWRVRDRVVTGAVIVPASEVSAYGTVQSHWQPSRRWGVDRSRPSVVWLRLIDDGEYLCAADNSFARPMPRSVLQERIDRMIAHDITQLRESRGE